MARQDPGEPYFRVDSNEARAMLDADPHNTVVVDVRRDDEWVGGHVTGAIPNEGNDPSLDRPPLFLKRENVGEDLAGMLAIGQRVDGRDA